MSSKGKKRKSDRRLDERDLDYFDDGKLPPDHVRDNDDDEQLREWTYGQTNAEEFENTRRRRREQREGKRNDTK